MTDPVPERVASGETLPVFDHYVTVRLVGRGAFGDVYEARSADGLDRVAIKQLRIDPALENYRDSDVFERFKREIKALQDITSDHVVRLKVTRTDADPPWFAMPYVDGHTLKHIIDHGQLYSGEALESLAIELASGLAAGHEKSVVHRDLKPSNAMSTPTGHIILDYGIALLEDHTRLSQLGVGTWQWAAPEQFENPLGVGPSTDIHAWALMICYTASGHEPLPDNGATITAYFAQPAQERRTVRAALGDLPEWLRPIVEKAVHQDPAQRHQDGSALLADLERSQQSFGRSASSDAFGRVTSLSTPPIAEAVTQRDIGGNNHPNPLLTALAVAIVLGLAVLSISAVRWVDWLRYSEEQVGAPTATPKFPAPRPPVTTQARSAITPQMVFGWCTPDKVPCTIDRFVQLPLPGGETDPAAILIKTGPSIALALPPGYSLTGWDCFRGVNIDVGGGYVRSVCTGTVRA